MRHFFPRTCNNLIINYLSAILLSLIALAAQAQTVPATAYTGPRYPGGPDSLRAVMQRLERSASPALVGKLYVQLTLDATGTPTKTAILRPPSGAPELALYRKPEAQAFAKSLVQRLPNWQPATPSADPAGTGPNTILLPFTFGPPVAEPLSYTDESPTLPGNYAAATTGGSSSSFAMGLLSALQRRLVYPAAALRSREQGTVYAYFEISETGAIEQQRIIGSAGPALDAEVLRLIQTIPSALTPPRYKGQPVRAAYTLPFTFRMQ
jgi:TonB family protein